MPRWSDFKGEWKQIALPIFLPFFCLSSCESLSVSVCCLDDSDDDREVSRKRTVRQAASKAVSKQREILLGDGGSEDEEHEDQEESYLDRMYSWTISCQSNT